MQEFRFGNLVVERYIVSPIEENTYLVYEENAKEAILVDPGDRHQRLAERIKKLGFKSLTIFLTHGHGDHIAGVEFFREIFPFAKLAVSQEDAHMLKDSHMNLSVFMGDDITLNAPDIILKEGDKIKTGSHEGIALHIPGHTRGGMALVFDEAIFSGDTLFKEEIGRSDLPGGDGMALEKAIKTKLFALSDRKVFPGHGEETTIDHEKSHNPYVAMNMSL